MDRREAARFARVIVSDLVHYFRTPSSPLRISKSGAIEFASHGLFVLRGRFGNDDALERYYADCVGSAFGSLTLDPPSLEVLRASATPLSREPPPMEVIHIGVRT